MEGHGVEASGGEKGPMQRGTVRILKTAAAIEPHGLFAGYPAKVMGKAAAAATQPRGLFAGYPAEGKADQEAAAASAAGSALALAAMATAMAQQAMEAAQRAAVLAAAASKQAEEASQADAFDQEEEEEEEAAATDADATDSEDEDEGDGMTSLEYIMTYKQLPPFEVELLLEEPVERMDFTDSQLFKDLSADPSATQDDFDDALQEHEERQDMRVRFHEWVRSEYEAKGYVMVSDEYIARRARVQQLTDKMWEEAFADFGEEDKEGAN